MHAGKRDDRYRQLRFQFPAELTMPQIMVEDFARSLIDRIMLEAFDLMDAKNEKLEALDDRSESGEGQPESAFENQLMEDRLRVDYNKLQTNILIEKMVHGLRNLQIGDSTSVPSHLTTLEKQVKHVVHSIENVSLDPPELAEMRLIQGQGDVQQIVHDAVIETSTASELARTRPEKENENTNEATRVSTSLLYRMIEELESRPDGTSREETDDDAISEDKIAVWEEREEQFIRTIESVDDTEQSTTDSIPDFRSNACELGYDGPTTTSSSFVHSALFARNSSLEEVAIEEITSLPECPSDASKKSRKSVAERSDGRKMGILSRTRKLLRAVFGRRKK